MDCDSDNSDAMPSLAFVSFIFDNKVLNISIYIVNKSDDQDRTRNGVVVTSIFQITTDLLISAL